MFRDTWLRIDHPEQGTVPPHSNRMHGEAKLLAFHHRAGKNAPLPPPFRAGETHRGITLAIGLRWPVAWFKYLVRKVLAIGPDGCQAGRLTGGGIEHGTGTWTPPGTTTVLLPQLRSSPQEPLRPPNLSSLNMYLVELRPGKEELYRTSEELAAAIRSGDVDVHSRIYHRATSKWISVTLHPHYKAIAAERDPAAESSKPAADNRAGWTFFNAASETLEGANDAPSEPPSGASPAVRWQGRPLAAADGARCYGTPPPPRNAARLLRTAPAMGGTSRRGRSASAQPGSRFGERRAALAVAGLAREHGVERKRWRRMGRERDRQDAWRRRIGGGRFGAASRARAAGSTRPPHHDARPGAAQRREAGGGQGR